MTYDSNKAKEQVRARFERDFGKVPDKMLKSFEMALEMVDRAMRLLIENGIEPVPQQQKVAERWGLGQISDEEFLAAARAIAAEHGGQ